jgi:uncharacterized membrane protein
MTLTLLVHIVAGASALALGAVALSATKGSRAHRKAGMLFAYAMLVMAVAGLLMAPLRGTAPAVNAPAAVLTAYLVITALTTLAPRTRTVQALDFVAMLVASFMGFVSLALGMWTWSRAGWSMSASAGVLLVLGIVGLLAAASDIRMLWSGGLRGASRIARHLWRMCFALCISATAFFAGQPDVFPRVLRKPALLALPALVALVVMFYWLWRVRIRGGYRAVIGVRD